MIELQYKHIFDSTFMGSFNELSSKKLNSKLAYQIMKIKYDLDKVASKHTAPLREKQKEILEKYAEKDDSGAPVFEKNGLPKIPVDNQSKANEDIQKILEATFTVEREKVDVTKLPSDALSADDMLILEPVLTGFEKLK